MYKKERIFFSFLVHEKMNKDKNKMNKADRIKNLKKIQIFHLFI